MFPPSDDIPANEISASLNSPLKPLAAALSPPASAIDQLSLNSSQQPALLNLREMIGEAEEPFYRSPKKPARTFALDFESLKENNKSIDDLVAVNAEVAEVEFNNVTIENDALVEDQMTNPLTPQAPTAPVSFNSPITAKHKSDEDLSTQQPQLKRALFAVESDQEEREVLSQNIDVTEECYLSQPVHFATQADDESPVKQPLQVEVEPPKLLVKTLSAEFEQKIASFSVSPQRSPVKEPKEASPIKSPQKLPEKSVRQIEFLQYEISSLQEKYEKSLETNAEMRSMLTEYERTLAQFIDARRTRPDQHSSLDELLRDKKKLELEIQTLQISFQNLHQRYEDIKGLHEQARINEATLKQSVQLLQQELAASIRNLDSTRKSYEDRLEKANMESLNLKASLENELSVTKARLLKSELKINSLESSIEAKTKENSELMIICDELIHKMDRKS